MLLTTILNHVQKFKSFSLLCSKRPSGLMPKRPRSTFLWRPEPTVEQYAASADGWVHAMVDSLFGVFLIFRCGGIPVTLVYAPRCVNCFWCGIRVESLSWTLPENPKSPLTETYAWYLARWAQRLPWSDTAKAMAFRTT